MNKRSTFPRLLTALIMVLFTLLISLSPPPASYGDWLSAGNTVLGLSALSAGASAGGISGAGAIVLSNPISIPLCHGGWANPAGEPAPNLWDPDLAIAGILAAAANSVVEPRPFIKPTSGLQDQMRGTDVPPVPKLQKTPTPQEFQPLEQWWQELNTRNWVQA